jgi:hypothetical protein
MQDEVAIAAVASKLNVGETSAPFEGANGVYVIEVVSKDAKNETFNATAEKQQIEAIYNKNYTSASLNYQLPVWYPDGGWRGVIFFKRLRLNVGADYASFDRQLISDDGSIIERRKHIASAGIDLGVDFNLFSMPNAATISATFSLYRKFELFPFNDGKMHFAFGMGLPF